MRNRTEYLPGTFCWVELATSNAKEALEFYTNLFRWSAEQRPTDSDFDYWILRREGMDAAALYQMENRLQSRWISYVYVQSVLRIIRKAADAGARVILGPQEVGLEGTMAIVQDPTGALIGFWQGGTKHGAQITGEPGSFCWNELATIDTSLAGYFYTSVLDWKIKEPSDYTFFYQEDRPAAGMFQMNEYWGNFPAHWIVYFAVEDCDETARKIESLGGTIHKPPGDIPGIGRLAIVGDPQGTLFAIIRLELIH